MYYVFPGKVKSNNIKMAKANQPKIITLSGFQITEWLGKGSYSEVFEGIQKVRFSSYI